MKSTIHNSDEHAFEAMITQIVERVVGRIDLEKLSGQKLAYSPEEVAELAGFSSARAVKAEANAGRLIGSKICNRWRFTPDQIRDYLQSQEVTV